MPKVFNLQGELGNQMFQVALGIALSELQSVEVKFKTTPGIVSRLSEFNCSQNFHIYEDSSVKTKLVNYLKRKSKRIKVKGEFQEAGVNYNHLGNSNASTFTGFFHSWRYFDHLKKKIQNEFDLINPSENFIELSKDLGTDFTAIHIRRGGQGAAILNSEFHGLVDEDYYNRALKLNRIQGGSENYVIFTDNIEKATDVIQKLDVKPIKIVTPADVHSQVENLHLMAKCSGFIGANSSYSWWAAYLSKNLKVNPIFPRQWYMNPELSNADMLLPDWISIGFNKFANEKVSRGLNAEVR